MIIQLIFQRQSLKMWQAEFEEKKVVVPPEKYCFHLLVKKELMISSCYRFVVLSDLVRIFEIMG